MKTTCLLRLLLILIGVLTFSPPVRAQTEPFEGLRFKEFSATIVRDWVSVHGMSNGDFISAYFNTTCKQVIQGGTNAFREITLAGYWDGNTGGYSNLTPAVVVTNCFALGSNGVVGALAADGLKPVLDGMGYTSYGAANPPNHEFQLPFQPFLGKGTI